MNFLRIFFAVALCLPVVVQANVGLLTSGESVESHITKGEYKHYKITALAGQTVTGRLDQLSADADLRIKIGSKALHHSFDCKSIHGGTQVDTCSVTLDHDADVYISVDGYRTADYRLIVTGNNEDKPLFSSGFEQGVVLHDVDDDGYMFIQGSDKIGNWPIDILGAEGSSLHVIGNNLDGPISGKQLMKDTILDAYIDRIIGHNGKYTDVLVTRKYMHPPNSNGENGYTQIPYTIRFKEDNRPKEDLYIRYWMKVDSDDERNDIWRAIFQYKTPSYDDGTGDNKGLRLAAYINKGVGDDEYYWQIKADYDPGVYDDVLNNDNDPATWSVSNRKVPVPINEWFLTEYYWHWSEGNDGKVVWKVNGQLIGEHDGPTTRNEEPLNIIMLSQTYGNQSNISQFVDDIEIWDGLPSRYKGVTELGAGDSLSSFASHGDSIYYRIPAKENNTLTAVLNKLSADADLYVRSGSKPTLQEYDCRSYNSGTRVEKCSVNLNQDSDIYILVHGYEAAKYRLKVDVSN